MKRLLSLSLSLLLALSMLAGCTQTPANSGGSAAPDRADADINWQYKTADETKAMLDAGDPVIILDTRTDDMYSAGHIPSAYHVPCFPVDTAEKEQLLKDAVPNLGGEDPIVVVCKTGNKGAKRAIALMQEEGIAASRLFILEGGGEGWSFPEYTTTENDSVTPGGGAPVEAATFTGKYIADPQYMIERIGNAEVVFVDARGEDAAKKGTVQGAVATAWQPLARCADGASGDEMWGTILPLDQLSQTLSAMGITPEKEIILFSDGGNGWGDDGRIAWELIAVGFPNVKIADRGFSALETAGVPTQKGASDFTPAEVTVTTLSETHLINTDALVAGYDGFKVVDVRADEEYDGKVLYGEKKGGHLPGAIHIRFTDLFDKNNVLKSNDEITAMFEAAGLTKGDTIVTYCTAGIRSAYMQMILEMCGYENSMNYDESYYRWCAVQDVE